MLAPSILNESVTFQNIKPCPTVTNPCRMLAPSIIHESVAFQNMKPYSNCHQSMSLITNSYEKKSSAEMLLILTILNVISKQNTTNRVEKNDLV